MKKLTAIILCALLILAFAACDSGSTTEETTTAAQTEAKTEAKTEEKTEAKTEEKTEAKTEEPTTEATTEATTVAPTEAPTEEPTTEAPAPEIVEAEAIVIDANTATEDHIFDLGYKWEKSSATLTLSGMNLSFNAAIGIQLDVADATIVIADGTVNNIVVTGFTSDDFGCYGIKSTGNLTITGNGVLNITTADFESDFVGTGGCGYGIFAKGKNITIESGEINITCGTVGGNYATLRNIQGMRAQDLNVKGGKLTINTGDCYTSDAKGAFLDGIYVTGTYNQTAGEVHIFAGSSVVVGKELFRENLAICADTAFQISGGFIELQAGSGSALGAPKIEFGSGKVSAGNTNLAPDNYYEKQLYLKVEY